MKKFLFSIICLLTCLTVNVKAVEMPEVTDHEKINVYMFRGHGCSACYGALTQINANFDKYSDYLTFVTYEVWNNKANASLLELVGETYDADISGIPFFVVGDSYTSIGFNQEELLKAVAKEYQNEKYVDKVKELAKKVSGVEAKTLKEACIEDEIIPDDSDTGNDTIVIFSIFGVVLAGVAALVIFSRK